MIRGHTFVWFIALLSVIALPAWGQSDDASAPSDDSAMEQSVAPKLNAPTVSLESQTGDTIAQRQGSFIDPLPEARSLFLGGFYLAQGLEASVGNNSQIYGSTRALGTLDFLKIGRHFEAAVDYRGGIADGVDSAGSHHFLQQMQATGRKFWQKTALTVSDSLGDYPGGSFGSTWFGGASAYNLGSTSLSATLPADPGIASFTGSNTLGSGPNRLNNVALVELTDTLTARSQVTVAGSYGLDEYFGSTPGFINSHQYAGLVNYGYQLSPRTEIGALYGYRYTLFPRESAGNIGTHVTQFTYSRSLSRNSTLQFGVGPEFSYVSTIFNFFSVPLIAATSQVNVSAYSAWAYRRKNATVTASYDRSVTSGSGIFAGANSDLAELSLGRQILRSWQASFNLGYTRLTQIQEISLLVPGNSYQFGFAGVAISRRLGPFRVLASYQFNDESSDTSFCTVSKNCNLSQRHTALIGITWHTRPIHLDHGSGQPSEIGPINNDGSEANNSHVTAPEN
jgi:hypothetical protein